MSGLKRPATADLERLIKLVRTRSVRRPGKKVRIWLAYFGMDVAAGFVGAVPPRVAASIRDELIHGIGVPAQRFDAQTPPADHDGSRGASLVLTGEDKKSAKTVSHGQIKLTCLPGEVLRVGGVDLPLPPGATLDVSAETARTVETQGIILVENLESFQKMSELTFEVPRAWRSYVVAFRGQVAGARQDTCEAWLREMAVPVICYPDFDPAGLIFGSRAPGVVDLLWPGEAALSEAIATHGSRALFEKQARLHGSLRGLTGAFAKAASIVLMNGKGLNQEVWHRAARADLRVSNSERNEKHKEAAIIA